MIEAAWRTQMVSGAALPNAITTWGHGVSQVVSLQADRCLQPPSQGMRCSIL